MDKLTISQALRRVKKLKGLLAEATQRANSGVSYANDKVPAFRFKESVDAMRQAQDEMVELESRIAIANATANINHDGKFLTLAKAIRALQEIKGNIAFYKSLFLRSETVKDKQVEWDDDKMVNKTLITEITYVSDLTEQERDKQVKALQDQFESLNNMVENANHQVVV